MSFASDIGNNIEDFTISPHIESTYAVSSTKITITFDEPLKYNQEYDVSFVATDSKNRSSTVKSRFKTSSVDGYYLTRSNSSEKDTIYRFSLNDDTADSIIYEAEEIILYELAKNSFASLEQLGTDQKLYVITENKKQQVSLPTNQQVNAIKGSTTKNSYIMRFIDAKLFTSSLWEYDADDNELSEIFDEDGVPIRAGDIDYAPDGESIVFQDQNRVLQLRNDSTDQPPLVFGEFNTLRRFLPNEKALFGYRNNKPIGIRASDGSFIEPIKEIETSYQTIIMQDLESYVYLRQKFNDSEDSLEQSLISYSAGKESIVTTELLDKTLFMSLDVSPNDQYVSLEEAAMPAVYDDKRPNSKPKNVSLSIYDRESGAKIKTINGFDIQWR